MEFVPYFHREASLGSRAVRDGVVGAAGRLCGALMRRNSDAEPPFVRDGLVTAPWRLETPDRESFETVSLVGHGAWTACTWSVRGARAQAAEKALLDNATGLRHRESGSGPEGEMGYVAGHDKNPRWYRVSGVVRRVR